LFTFVSSAGTFCLVVFEKRAYSASDIGRALWGLLLIGQALFALSCYVRYAGYFFVASAAMYLAGAFLVRRTARAFATLASCAVAGALVVPLLIRNTQLSGSWRGNTEAGTAEWSVVLQRTIAVFKHLLYGSSRDTSAGLWGIITVVSLIVMTGLALRSRRAIELRSVTQDDWPDITLAATIMFGYTVFMIYAGVCTGISKDPRMYLPIVPLLALCAGWAINWQRRVYAIGAKRGRYLLAGAVAANLVAYAALNGEDVASRRPYSPHRPITHAFSEVDNTGIALSSWVDAHIPQDVVVLAACGQQTGYVLKRRTISLFNLGSGARECGEQAIRRSMDQYDAGYLILYPGIQSSCGIQLKCKFLSSLTTDRTPDWLEFANSSKSVVIFRHRTATTGAADVGFRRIRADQ